MWEYTAFRLWEYVSAEPMNDAGGTAGLLNARGAEGWELVSVVEQRDPDGKDGTSYVAYIKRPASAA